MKKIKTILIFAVLFSFTFAPNYSAMPNGNSKSLESRGIWLTPGYFMEEPEDAIRAVDEIADAGFNIIFLEMNRTNGYAQYDSELVPVLEPFNEFDPAKLVLERAKERGLEVHAYFHTLNNPYLVANNPEWAMVQKEQDAKIVKVNESLINKINNTNSSRGANQLILYTPDHGTATGTNIYGTEVVVVNGLVTDVENNRGNISIPSNGVVLSGNGIANTWLRENIKVGDTISIESDEDALVPSSSWMEPGNHEVITELKKHVEEILTKYDFDGFHFDHIRYPPTDGMVEIIFDYILEGNPSQWSTDVYGYSIENRERFESLHGIDPLDITIEDEEAFLNWWEFRSDNITNLVTELSNYAKSFNDNLVISAALTVRPAYDDWETMYSGVDYEKLSYPLDVVIPMAYHLSAGEAEFLFPRNRDQWLDHVAKGALKNIGDRAMLYMGIGGSSSVHDQWTSSAWNNAVDIVRESGAHGVAAFEYIVLGHMVEDTTNFKALANGVFKKSAKPMHSIPGFLKKVRKNSQLVE